MPHTLIRMGMSGKGGGVRRFLAGAALAASASLPLATPAFAVATPPETGCPASYQVLVVADLVAEGYVLGPLIDAEGNQNGLVCGKPLAPKLQEKFCEDIGGCTVDVIYFFRDDDLPAAR